jgi:hypothetical protein
MATPIRETPILRGKDAERFNKRMAEVDAGMHKVSREEYLRAKEAYESVGFGKKND